MTNLTGQRHRAEPAPSILGELQTDEQLALCPSEASVGPLCYLWPNSCCFLPFYFYLNSDLILTKRNRFLKLQKKKNCIDNFLSPGQMCFVSVGRGGGHPRVGQAGRGPLTSSAMSSRCDQGHRPLCEVRTIFQGCNEN